MSPRVTVFIPTLNAGPELAAVIAAIRSQRDVEPEISVIDSGSTDGTRELLERECIRHRVIAQRDFDHGETRNAAIRDADTDLVALLSQDARPADDHWLARLVAPFADPLVAGAFARQVPRPGCHPFQRVNAARHAADAEAREVREPLDARAWAALAPPERLERIRFDNVSSVVRRAVVAELPFPRAAFGEDLAWGRRAVLGGYRLVYCPGAAVLHSHAVTTDEFGRRVRATHEAIARLTGFVPIPNRRWLLRRTAGQVLRLARAALAADDWAPWRRAGAVLAALPYGIRQMSAMYAGGHAAPYEPPTGP